MRTGKLESLIFVVCKVKKEFNSFSAYFWFSEMDRGFLTSFPPSESSHHVAFTLYQTSIETFLKK